MNVKSNNHSIRFQATIAARQGNLVKLKELYLEYESELKKLDETRSSLLHDACAGGNVEVVEWLIGKGFDLNTINIYGATPLFEATYHNHVEVVKLLQIRGAKLKVPNYIKFGSYMAFGISGISLIPIIIFSIYGNFNTWKILLIFMLSGITISGVINGIKGLLGKQTISNS